jgi:hypothetical protein
MDNYLYNTEQPTETSGYESGWTEWWVVDESGLHLEYADGYDPADEEHDENTSETVHDGGLSKFVRFVIYADEVYESHSRRIHERWEDVLGKIDYKKSRLLEQVKEPLDESYEPRYYPYPISTDEYDNPDYLDFLQGAIDEYHQWYDNGNGVITNTPPPEPQEESIVELPKKDGLILPGS